MYTSVAGMQKPDMHIQNCLGLQTRKTDIVGSFGARLGFNRSFDDQQQEPTPSTFISSEAMIFEVPSQSLSPQIVIMVDGDISRSCSPSYSGSKYWHPIPRRDILHVTLVE